MTLKKLDSLYQDCQGNVFAMCSDSAFELKLYRKKMLVRQEYLSSVIKDFIMPVCGISDSLVFLKKSSPNLQYDNYFAIKDTQCVMVVYTTGGLMRESKAVSARHDWRKKGEVMVTLNIPPGCEGSCIFGWLENVYEPTYFRYFSSHFWMMIDFPPEFTKMFTLGKSKLIFDRQAATIFWIGESGEITKEVGMNNKLNGLYYQDVHLDTGTGRIYVEYAQGPYTHFMEINPETGQEIRRFMVRDYRHIEKCEFLNGRLYFLYQPDTGLKIKKIYSMWI